MSTAQFEKIAKARGLKFHQAECDGGCFDLELLDASLDSAIGSAKELKAGKKVIDGLRRLRNEGSPSEKFNFVHGEGSFMLPGQDFPKGQIVCKQVIDGAIAVKVTIVYNGLMITYPTLKIVSHLECKILPR